jgi:hypothetical protein
MFVGSPSVRAARHSSVLACRANSRRHLLLASTASCITLPTQAADGSIYDFTVEQYGERVPMSKYRGDVLVIVNVASE